MILEFDRCNTGLALEKQKAEFLIYCFVEFRNHKATMFNVLYLAIADQFRKCYKGDKCITAAVEEFVKALRLNAPLRRKRNMSFFSLDFKMNIEDKCSIYERAHGFCCNVYTESEPATKPFINKLLDNSKDTPYLFFKDSVLAFFDTAEMTYIYNRILKYFAHYKEPTEENFFNSPSEFLSCLYQSISLTLRSDYLEALTVLRGLNIDKLQKEKTDNDVKEQLALLTAAACMLALALFILDHAALDIKEAASFLCRVLVDPTAAVELFEKVKVRADEGGEICLGAALVLEMSMSEVAVARLVKVERSVEEISIGYLLLSMEIDSGERIGEYAKILKDCTNDLCKHFLALAKKEKYALTTIASALSPKSCSIFASIVLNRLGEYGILFIDSVSEEVIKKPLHNSELAMHEPIKVFTTAFGGEFSLENFNKLLEHNGQLLLKMLEEIVGVVSVCKAKSLVEIDAASLNNWPQAESVQCKELIKGIHKAVELFWRIIVMTIISDYITSPKPNLLKFINSLLKSSNKAKEVSLLASVDVEGIKELAHALSDCGSKVVQDEVLRLVKTVSSCLVIS